MAGKKNDISHETALELLQIGNRRYVGDLATRPNATPRRRYETGSGQWPFAIVLTCADSRVAPELIFDQGIGDLFVVRVAGNIATSEIIASIQYAVMNIETELIVVLGHEGCGAVHSALSLPCGAKGVPDDLAKLVTQIQGVVGCKDEGDKDVTERELQKAVERNVKSQVSDLRKVLRASGAKGAKVVPASYGLRSGEVDWL